MFNRNIFVTNNSKALTTSERNVKLFLLFVANTTDKEIGTADRKNMTDAIAFFRNVKDFLGISSFVFDTITGRRLNKTNVENAIKTFYTPGRNDIVVFYFSGHGFRKEKDGRPAPYIDLRDETNTDYMVNSLNLEDISLMIQKKEARLNLILSDCCNDNVTKSNPMAKDGALSGKKGLFDKFWNTQKCRDLFLNAMPSTILATAAMPYQLAISNAVFGGYFSNHFINTLETNLSLANKNPTVTWDIIFDQTLKQTETKSGRTWCNDEGTIKCNRQRPYKCISYNRMLVPCM